MENFKFREADQGIAAWFVKKKSCLTNLLVVLEEITDYLDFGKSGYPVDVIMEV